jgi:hypothetical protein
MENEFRPVIPVRDTERIISHGVTIPEKRNIFTKPEDKREKLKTEKLMNRLTEAKTFLGYLRGSLSISRNDKNEELSVFIEELIKKYQEFEVKSLVRLNSWKGKDQIKIIELPDSFDIIRHQKPDQDHEAKEILRNIPKIEVNNVIWAINHSKNYHEENFIQTQEIARHYCIAAKITKNKKGNELFYPDGTFEWQHFFGCRFLHTELNLILRLLDYYNVIKYRAGRTNVLKRNFQFQTTLK